MAKDYKYEDSTPVDEPVRRGSKVQEPGSDIRVDGKPIKSTPKKDTDPLGEAADNTMKMIVRKRDTAEEAGKSKTNAMGDTYAKGGTASSRADGCCTKGKTRGKMM
jgi:hypothetical protein